MPPETHRESPAEQLRDSVGDLQFTASDLRKFIERLDLQRAQASKAELHFRQRSATIPDEVSSNHPAAGVNQSLPQKETGGPAIEAPTLLDELHGIRLELHEILGIALSKLEDDLSRQELQ